MRSSVTFALCSSLEGATAGSMGFASLNAILRIRCPFLHSKVLLTTPASITLAWITFWLLRLRTLITSPC